MVAPLIYNIVAVKMWEFTLWHCYEALIPVIQLALSFHFFRFCES